MDQQDGVTVFFSERHKQTLTRILRVMYPHDSFSLGPYERTA